MKKKPSVQYTVRDVPEEIDSLLRESATLEGVSLNQATLHADAHFDLLPSIPRLA